MNILNELEKIYPSLPRQERKVALQAIQEPKKIQRLSINELAKLAGTSNATITRLVKRLDCANFYDFKLRLVSDEQLESKESESKLAMQVQRFYEEVLTQTRQRIDEKVLLEIVNKISTCRRIYIFGLGSSGYTAKELTQRLIRMGIAAFGMTESHSMYISSGIVEKDDVILALSATGNTAEVNRAAKAGQKKGATLIAITGIEDSPLYQLSDLALLVKNSNFVDNARFINSQFAMTYIVDIITTLLLDEKDHRTKMDQTIELINTNSLRVPLATTQTGLLGYLGKLHSATKQCLVNNKKPNPMPNPHYVWFSVIQTALPALSYTLFL